MQCLKRYYWKHGQTASKNWIFWYLYLCYASPDSWDISQKYSIFRNNWEANQSAIREPCYLLCKPYNRKHPLPSRSKAWGTHMSAKCISCLMRKKSSHNIRLRVFERADAERERAKNCYIGLFLCWLLEARLSIAVIHSVTAHCYCSWLGL